MIIGIVGLGLIGGSVAKSIKARTDDMVLGIDLNEETMALAKMSGSIDGVLTDDKLESCDIIMIAVAPVALAKWVEEKASLIKGTLLIDLCGVKRHIGKFISEKAKENGFSYIGGHPMAGKEVSGFKNSNATLFSGASMILIPDEHSDILMLDKVKTYFLNIGFERITFSTPEEHDMIIAYTSQLAHITSSAYIKSPTAQKHMGFSAGSYKDMTRVAKLDENLWTELFLDNSDYLIDELKTLIGHLSDYLNALETNDSEVLKELLKKGRELKLTAGGE